MEYEKNALVVPTSHGEAHRTLSDARCGHNGNSIGCNFIDVAKATVGHKGEEHQRALIEAAKKAENRVCAICPIGKWATGNSLNDVSRVANEE